MLSRTITFRSGVFLCLALAFTPAMAQDWPQWRGPQRDGTLRGFVAPASWPDSLKQVWRTPIGSGYSSPVTGQGRVYVHCRRDEQEIVSCVELESGKILWSTEYSASFANNPYATSMDKGPRSTPVLHNGRLYTLGATTVLSCFEAATGELKWRKDFSRQMDTSKLFTGAAMSPIIDGGRVIAHVGDDRIGWLIAFDAESGSEKWKLEGDGPGYASPMAVDIGGTRQIITLTDKSAVGVAAANGKLLWSIPYPDEWIENIVTPVVYEDLLILSGVRKSTRAIRVIKSATGWSTELVWENKDVPMYMSSPVVSGDYLIGFSNRRSGQFFCLEAKTGNTLWKTDGREGTNAAVVAADGFLFFLTDSGRLTVARPSPRALDTVAHYTVADGQSWAHPVISTGSILVKDHSALTLWSFD